MLNTLHTLTTQVKKECIDFSKQIQSHYPGSTTEFDVDADGYEFIAKTTPEPKLKENLKKEQSSFKKIVFKALDTLEKKEPVLKLNDQVNICLFRIVKNSYKPYLLYGLYKENHDNIHKNNTLTHFSFKYTGGLASHDAISYTRSFIENEYNNTSFQLLYKGYCRSQSGVKMWIECDNFTEGLEKSTLKTNIWWGMVSEIVNQRKVLQFNVRPEVTHFLLEKPEYLFLHDENECIYEQPIAGYLGNYYYKVISDAVIGKQQELPTSDTGVCYKFSTYNSALRDAFWTQNYCDKKINKTKITVGNMGKYKRGGLAKFVIFLGKHTMYEGMPIKNWKKKYDSISDGFDIYVVKEQQYIPVSYYEINTEVTMTPSTIHNATIVS